MAVFVIGSSSSVTARILMRCANFLILRGELQMSVEQACKVLGFISYVFGIVFVRAWLVFMEWRGHLGGTNI